MIFCRLLDAIFVCLVALNTTARRTPLIRLCHLSSPEERTERGAWGECLSPHRLSDYIVGNLYANRKESKHCFNHLSASISGRFIDWFVSV